MKSQSKSAVLAAALYVWTMAGFSAAVFASGERAPAASGAAKTSPGGNGNAAKSESGAGGGAPEPQAPRNAAGRQKKTDAGKTAESATRDGTFSGKSQPPLDLEALEKRLKDTEAIGFFTKLTLKNEVDGLLERFRTHYEGRGESTLSELRPPYDTLILKVLSLLQDSDPALAKDIAKSREAIWGILSDREKFAKL